MSISVVLPTFNRADLVAQAIESVCSQLDAADELIVVDDGSTDNTESVVSGMEGPIKYVRTENRGAGAARNRGIEEASSDLVTFVDSDNYWLPGKIALQRQLMESRPDLVCCFTNFVTSRSTGEETANGIRYWFGGDPQALDWFDEESDLQSLGVSIDPQAQPKTISVGFSNFFPILIGGNYIPVWTAMIRKSMLEPADRFPTDVKTHEEWEFFGRVTRRGLTAFVDIDTAHNIAHDGPRLTDADAIDRFECELKILERVWGQDSQFRVEFERKYADEFVRRASPLVRDYISKGKIDQGRSLIDRVPSPTFELQVFKLLPDAFLHLIARLIRT